VTAAVRHGPALWPAYLATFTFMLGQWASGVAVPLHVDALGGTVSEAGTIAAIRFGLGAFFSLPFGAIADAWGARRTLIVAVVGNALVNLVPIGAAVGGSTLPLYAWAVLSGLTASLFLPAISAYVAGAARPAKRGSAFGWLTLGTHAGVASGPAVGGVVWDGFGIVPTYLVSSLLGFAALAGPLLVAGASRTHVDLRALPRMVRGVAGDRVIVGTWLAALGIGLPWGAVAGLFPIFGTSIGLTAGSVGLLLGLQSLVNGASRVPLGRLIDRHPVRPAVMSLSCLLYVAIIGLLGLQTGPLGIALVFVASVVALAFTLMLVQVVISERAPPELRATGLGGYSTSLSAGLGIGPFLTGAVTEAAGFGAGFAAIAAVAAGAALLSGLLLVGARRVSDTEAAAHPE
jgi:MFS family permease